MDLSLLPTPVSEHNSQRAGARFTVRPANSPSYSITRRPGVRKPRDFSEEERESVEEAGEREIYRKNICTNGANKKDDTVTGYQTRTDNSDKGQCESLVKETSSYKLSTMLYQNGTADKNIIDFGVDRSHNPASESQGKTEWRGYDLASRSKSLDWRTRARSPDRSPDMSCKQGGDISKQGRIGLDGVRGRLMSAINNSSGTSNVQERIPVSYMTQTLDRVRRDHSLPSRLRPQSGPGSGFRETASSVPKGGQSISDRIEKLYGSAGFSKTEDYRSTPDFHISSQQRSYEKGAGGNKETGGNYLAEKEGKSTDSGNNWTSDFGKYSELKHTLEIPLNEGAQQRCRNFYVDKSDFSKVSSPEETHNKDMTDNNAASGLLSNSRESLELCGVKKMTPSGITPPVSDDDKTPTNTPNHSPFLSPQNATPNAETENKSTSLLTQATTTHPETDSPPLLRPLATSSHSNLHDLISPDASTAYPKGKKQAFDLDAWLAGLNSKIKVWNDDEDDYEDDDESTQKDEDSNYDSDSGESSVTITSNMSQSDRRSFCVSLSDLCNFAGVDYESENDSDEGQSTCQRTASLSSDVSALSCVSIMPSEELDRLLEDVRGLGDNTLQDYNDVQVVVLHKEVGVGLGFSVAGGVDQNKPVTVHKVFHSGVAAQEGSISEGDQVLSINGTALCDFAHWEALRVLRRAKTREMGVVVLRKGGVSNISKGGAQINNQGLTQTQITETGQRVCVSLVKNSRDLGFSLEGGVGSRLGNRPLSIQKIFQGGPFDKVFPGDEVVEIEGISVVGMRRLEAWTLIRQLPPGPVDVILCRSITHLET
ncbi:pro-interleukin-16 [Scomber scombrus]|uniref:pro-interleukin-16 n=1 Tax=Scomber scombrus TaxID=13677 RepID=UPI002DD8D0F6|nr:pro-interleukin-16 [Scomber scombrus]